MAILTQIHTAGGPQESACDWCPFASACWFDENGQAPLSAKRPRRKNSGSWWTRR